jgi:ParB/RepB/Spo0J family partition protein
METIELRLNEICASRTNPRRHFDKDRLAELAESIRTKGVLQPILVRTLPHGHPSYDEGFIYEVIAGERRYRASCLAERLSIPAQIRDDLSEMDILEIQAIENDQREDVLPSERALGYQRLINAGRSIAQVADKVGKSESWVRNVLRIGALPQNASGALDAGVISQTTAELIARVPGEQARTKVALCVLQGKIAPDVSGSLSAEPLTTRQTKDLIRIHFNRELKTAPFDTKDATLPPGSCTSCEKRAGNAGLEYADVRADMCLDVVCFAAKAKLAMEREIKLGGSANVTVMPLAESKKLFHHGYFSCPAEFEEVSRLVPYSMREQVRAVNVSFADKPITKVLGKKMSSLIITVAYSPDGLQRIELVKVAHLKKLIDELYPPAKSKADKPVNYEPSDYTVKQKAHELYTSVVADAMLKESLGEPSDEICQMLFVAMMSKQYGELPDQLVQIFSLNGLDDGVRDPKALAGYAKSIPADQLLKAVILLALAFISPSSSRDIAYLDDLATDYLVSSFSQLEKTTRDEMKKSMKKGQTAKKAKAK